MEYKYKRICYPIDEFLPLSALEVMEPVAKISLKWRHCLGFFFLSNSFVVVAYHSVKMSLSSLRYSLLTVLEEIHAAFPQVWCGAPSLGFKSKVVYMELQLVWYFSANPISCRLCPWMEIRKVFPLHAKSSLSLYRPGAVRTGLESDSRCSWPVWVVDLSQRVNSLRLVEMA